MLTGQDVLKDYDKKIDFKSFSNEFEIAEKEYFDRKMVEMFKMKGINFNMCYLNTSARRAGGDIVSEIIACDYVWMLDDICVAFWKRSTKTLYY